MQELNKHKLHVPNAELALVYQLSLSWRRTRPKISTSPDFWSSQDPTVLDFSMLARGPWPGNGPSLPSLECDPSGPCRWHCHLRKNPASAAFQGFSTPKINKERTRDMEGARQCGQLGGWRGGNAWGSDSGIPRLLVKIGKWIPGGRLEGWMLRKGWITG